MPATPFSRREGVVGLSEAACPTWLAVDVSYLRTSDYVEGPVDVFRDTERSFFGVRIQVCFDRPARIRRHEIVNPEPIFLWYAERGGPRGQAPSIYTERPDFPRNLPHLNPVPEDDPASPCIARDGVQALYDHGGILAVLHRLAEWLADASVDGLDQDGWEPAPVAHYGAVSLDAAAFQGRAHKSSMGTLSWHSGRGFGLSIFHVDPVACLLKTLRSARPEERDVRPIFACFVAGPASSILGEYGCQEIRTQEQLQARFAAIGAPHDLQAVLNSVPGEPELLLMLAVRRPKPLITDIPGLAAGDARRIEIESYYLERNLPGTVHVRRLAHIADARPTLFASMSGAGAPLPQCTVLGCGALGSKVAAHLVRRGIEALQIVDKDVVLPHNLARHATVVPYGPKADLFRQQFEHLGARITSKDNCDITEIEEGAISKTLGKRSALLIDATASVHVSRRLTQGDQAKRVVRLEIADEGRLGFALVEGATRTPRIDDLRAHLYCLASSRQEVSDWLQRDRSLTPAMLGSNCASATMRMADSTVSLHAAALYPAIEQALAGECGGIQLTWIAGRDSGATWLTAPSFSSFFDEGTGWEIRVAQPVCAAVQARMRERSPVETGGFLYGCFDSIQRTIIVVATFPVVPDAASPSRVILPGARSDAVGEALLRASRGRLARLGAWHSHPQGTPGLSRTDRRQLALNAGEANRVPQPWVAAIQGAEELRLHLELPTGWA